MSAFGSKQLKASNCNEVLPNNDGSINTVIISGAVSGNQKFFSGIATSTPGTQQVLITYIVPLGKTLTIYIYQLAFSFDSDVEVLINGTVIASGKTGPLVHKDSFSWIKGRPIIAGETLELKFKAQSWTPTAQDVEAYIEGVET